MPQEFHKTFETSCRSIKKVRDETHNLSRRHSYFGKNQSATGTEQKYHPVSLTDAWFQNKLGEIKVKTRSQYFFLGFEINSSNMLFKLPEEKVQKKNDCKRVRKRETISVRILSQLIGT